MSHDANKPAIEDAAPNAVLLANVVSPVTVRQTVPWTES
jgi:hypothetical protein